MNSPVSFWELQEQRARMLNQYNLSFPKMPYGTHEGKYDLKSLLYTGASGEKSHLVMDMIESGMFGYPDPSRLPLALKIHEELEAQLARGMKPTTVKNRIRILRSFYSWCDRTSLEITVATAPKVFRLWVEYLLHRVRIEKSLLNMTAYQWAKSVDNMLKPALGLSHNLILTTRLVARPSKYKVFGSKADKQDLNKAFEFGHFLMDISSGLSLQAMIGTLPIEIKLRRGDVLVEFAGLHDIALANSYDSAFERIRFTKRRGEVEPELVFTLRKSLANLKISAELLIFISQTGMNLSQACKLKRGAFRYQNFGGDVLVYRAYKGRRMGEVEFVLFKEYVPLFKLYLEWLDKLSDPSDERLFPIIYTSKIPNLDHLPTFATLYSRCKDHGIKPLGPQILRKTRVNWLLRKSRSPDLVAEMAQHTKETLLRVYEEPNHQAAAAEISRFYRVTDPATASVGPGMCLGAGRPVSIVGAEPPPFTPDCTTPAGCMFCEHQRDLDSQDYVWALASYRHLKLLELDRYVPPTGDHPPHPVSNLIHRIGLKLKSFVESGVERSSWLTEAEARLKEGRFHENFDGLIQLMEMSQ